MAAALVVLIAAALLLTIIALARRIVRQAGEIEAALVGARVNTDPLFDVASVNHALESLGRSVKRLRGAPERGSDERSLVQRIASVLSRKLAP